MSRPSCVVNLADLPGEKRPRYTAMAGVAAVVRQVSAATGLTRMGVHVRAVEPGFAGTNRHFHTVEEEWSYVLAGRGILRIGPLALPVRAGHFAAFPPGPRPHHFLAEGDETLVFLEGGERRPAEDSLWYPDARKMLVARQAVEPYEEPPPEEGDARQVLHIDDVPITVFRHDVDGEVQRRMRSLHRPTGLERQAVHWAQVERGRRSTVFHTHDRTDEWIFVLSGRGVARVGDERFEVGPNDFLGHPAGGTAHVMEAIDELTYLVGGEIDACDIVSYPEAGLRRVGGQLEPLVAGIASGARVEFEIREERADDAAAIREVQRLAFGQAQESELVDALRANGAMLLSLVAVSARRVVGHVAYSPVSVGNASGAGLGPMAVLPEQQRRGIGRALIEEGNRKLEAKGCPFVVVVGHPGYYPRFGFRRASEHGVVCEWDLPDDVFMLRVLDRDAMRELKGLAKYRTEFSSVT